MRIILTTVGDDSQADKLANEILKRKMAACVSKIPIRSKYWWKGVLEESSEILLIIKTVDELVRKLISFLEENHPYEVPEIIALPVEEVSKAYEEWLYDVTEV